MIYDCFSFFNELDILEIRLNTLNEIVDKFVLVEATWTHTGKPKPLYFEQNKAQFAPFLDKIIHIVATDEDLPTIPPNATEREIAWIRENVQRNAIAKGLKQAKPEDILIISDLDEIPRPEAVLDAAQNPRGITNLNLKNYAFFLNNLNVSSPDWVGGPQLLSYKAFTDVATYAHSVFSEYAPQCANSHPSATLIRFAPKNRTMKNAGWHFTSMGGVEALQQKLRSFAHTEFSALADDPKELLRRINCGERIFFQSEHYMAIPARENLPAYIFDNNPRFSKMLLCAKPLTARVLLHQRIWRLRKCTYDFVIGTIIRMTPKRLHPLFAAIRRRIRV